MNVRMDSKYYSVDEAVKMLPYIKAYCRDLQKCYIQVDILTGRNQKLSNLTSISKEKKQKIERIKENIRLKIEFLMNKFKRWTKELNKLHITVCSLTHGRVDVPVYCNGIEAVINLCVTPETTSDSVEWHLAEESHEHARKYFEKVY